MSPGQAFLSALFFIALPPSYQEVPNIAKSMIAEPLAVGALLLGLRDSQSRFIPGVALSLLSLLAHYTLGIFLAIWFSAAWFVTGNRRVLLTIAVIVTVGTVYFSVVGGGSVSNGIIHWGKLPEHSSDSVMNAVKGQAFEISSPDYHPYTTMTLKDRLAIPTLKAPASPVWAAKAVLFAVELGLLFGGLYWLKHKMRYRAMTALVAVSIMMVLAAMFIPFVTRGLFISRWVQISAIPLCGLYGLSSAWARGKCYWVAYGCAVVILVALLTFVR